MLQLVTVDKEWSILFEKERLLIVNALGDRMIDIQHIGSTAIPGIIAKPILDIAIAIHDFNAGYGLVPMIIALGYIYRGENGIPKRHYFERDDTYHLHIFEHDSQDWWRHINFRDQLLSSHDLVERYSQVKLDAARESNGERRRYQSLKSSFIQKIERL